MKSLSLPTNDAIADRFINRAFNLYDRDFLNGIEPDVSISKRVQLVIEQYELFKPDLYDQADYVI